MSNSDRVLRDIKKLEDDFRSLGDHRHAEQLASMRRSYAQSILTLKTLHRDNMALHQKVKAALDACDCADDLVAQQEPISASSVTIWVRRALTTTGG